MTPELKLYFSKSRSNWMFDDIEGMIYINM